VSVLDENDGRTKPLPVIRVQHVQVKSLGVHGQNIELAVGRKEPGEDRVEALYRDGILSDDLGTETSYMSRIERVQGRTGICNTILENARSRSNTDFEVGITRPIALEFRGRSPPRLDSDS
jgi:hypothetical protein